MAKTADYEIGEFTFPRGWFMIAEAEEVTMKPKPIRFFGQDMVVYRGMSGRVVVMDAYCPHMGTHLAKNESSYVVLDGQQVDGDSIRCPYHGWKFGPDGKCEEIPYSPADIPKSACIQTWPIEEEAGIVFMWHDPEGGEPDYDLPRFPQWNDPAWVRWKVDHLGVLNCHPQEIIDNIADKAHLGPIHGSMNMELFENEFKDHSVRQNLAAGHRTLANDVLTNDTYYIGPGILISKMVGFHETVMLICHTPVEDGSVQAWHALLVKGNTDQATHADVATARQYQEGSKMAFLQDFDVWSNKRPCLKPMQVIGDGPFGKTRTWYKQFFNPRSQAKSFQEQVNGMHITKGTNRDPWPEATTN